MTSDPNGRPDASKPGVPKPKTHEIKCWPAYFHALADGRKTFELRRDDRDYRQGDTLHVREWCPVAADYTGRVLTFSVSYVLRKHPEFGLEDGFAILSLTPAEVAAREAAAAAEMRVQCKRAALDVLIPDDASAAEGHGRNMASMEAAMLIAALPLPAPDALARMLAAERRAGMEEEREACAQIADVQAKDLQQSAQHRMAAVLIALAIRARMEEQA